MSKNNTSRVQTNLIQQNCFVRDVTRKIDLQSSSPDSFFYSLDEEISSEGVKLVSKEVPYHITPDYVSSFASGVDYKRDPLGAVSCSSPRKNLGDISGISDVMSMDTDTARALYAQLSSRFSSNLSKSSSDGSSKKVDNGGDK